jgi:hypothetical protein
MLSQLLTLWIRLSLEYLYLASTVALFCLLVVMQNNFASCSRSAKAPPLLVLVD